MRVERMLQIQAEFDDRILTGNRKYSKMKHVAALINEVAEVQEVLFADRWLENIEKIRGELVDCYAFWSGLFLKYGPSMCKPNSLLGETAPGWYKGDLTARALSVELNVLANKMMWALQGDFKYWSHKPELRIEFEAHTMYFFEILSVLANRFFSSEDQLMRYYKEKMGINHSRQDGGY